MRYSRQEVVNTIRYNLENSGIRIVQVVTIEEAPDQLRHACFETGITFLQKMIMQVPDEQMGMIMFPFYYCPHCGKLYVYRFLYD